MTAITYPIGSLGRPSVSSAQDARKMGPKMGLSTIERGLHGLSLGSIQTSTLETESAATPNRIQRKKIQVHESATEWHASKP